MRLCFLPLPLPSRTPNGVSAGLQCIGIASSDERPVKDDLDPAEEDGTRLRTFLRHAEILFRYLDGKISAGDGSNACGRFFC